MKRNILFLLSICVLLFSCSDKDDPIKEVEKPPVENKDPFITLKKSNIDFTNEGGSESILIESNVTWTTKSSASWCTVTPSSGDKSTASITLTAPVNKEYDNRSCTVTIENGNITKTITVNQGENLGLLITQDKYELGNEESTIKVEVKANVDFEVEINDKWISKVDTRGLTTSQIEFKIAENETYGNREGSITIKQKGGGMTSTITIFQSQEDAIILSEKEFDLSSKAQSVEVEVKTNIDYEIIIPEDAKDWVTHASTRALRTETVVLDIDQNKDYDERIAKIVVKDKKTNLQDTLTINQAANTGLIISENKYEVTNDGGIIEIEVKANVEFDIEIADNWITRVNTRGLTATKIQFQVAKNENYDSREGSITIKQKSGNLSSTIKVYQSQKDAIILSEKIVDLSQEKQAIQVELKTNVEFEVIIPEAAKSWVSYTPTRGLRTENLTLNISENKDYTTRSTEVYVKNKKTNLQDTLTINQAANTGLIISEDKYELSNDGGTIEVEVKANVEFDIETPDSWITRVETRGLTATKLQFEVAKNKTYDNREGTITIKQKGGNLSSTIKVYQSQKDAIIISEKTFVLTSEKQAIEVELKTNVEFQVIIPEAAKSWVSYTPTRGLRTENLTLNISENKDYDGRSTEIYVKDKKTNLQDTLTINQVANTGLIVSEDKYELSNDGGTIEVEVKANVAFDIEIADSWITRVETRGLTATKLQFEVAKNKTYDNREGTITIKQKDGNLSSTIKVYQSQKDAIIISDKLFELNSEYHELKVELKTNVEFEVIIPDTAKNWLSYIETRALRDETITLIVEKNESKVSARLTEVYIKNKKTNLQDTLRIKQEEAPDLPTLTTLKAYDVLISSAKTGGVILSDGGAPILKKGVCWDRGKNPTVKDAKVESEVEGNEFEVEITRLDAETEYYVRAYATNRAGTAYGNEIAFRTTSTVATPIVNPSGGIYTTAQNVTISSATEGAEIRYTLDGSDPVETSELYSGAIVIDAEVTIKAKAFKTNWMASSIVKETYTIALGAQLIEVAANPVQHIDVVGDFVLSVDNLDNKDVFFVFSNDNERDKVDLPRLQSNVQTVSNIVKSSSGTPDATPFLVSGIPSVTEFNNNPVVKSGDGMAKAQYQQYLASQPERLSVGSKDYLKDDSGNPELSTVRKVISAHGKKLYVWVADNCWYEGGAKSYNVTQEMVDALANKFLSQGNDNDIYEWVTNIAGEPWGPTGSSYYIPETNDIHIWLMDIYNDNKTTGTVTLGYFYARDNYLRSVLSHSNEKLLFTIDAVLFAKPDYGAWNLSHFWPNELISTLAHEFTHMIYFYQKTILSNQLSNTAINEMCAQCVEDLVANKIHSNGPRGVSYGTPSAGYRGNYSGRLPLYNTHNEYNLLVWYLHSSHRLLNYSKTYALGAYLMRNYGGAKLIRELVQNRYSGTASIVEAVNSNGGAVSSYGDVLQQFGAANLLSDRTNMTTGYKFNSDGWNKSTVNGITYDLGAINLYNYSPTPNIYYQLPSTQEAGSNVFYRAGGNLSGKNEWYFKGLNKDTKVTVVVK